MRTHRYAVGQPVRYAEDSSPNKIWLSGYEIVALLPAGSREPQYQIRSDDQTYDQVVWESQLKEFGSRTMRLSHHAMRSVAASASPDRRIRHSRNDLEKPSQHLDFTRWDDEGGAPRSGRHSNEPLASQLKAETALYYFNIRTENSFVGDSEGDRYPDLQAAREVALAMVQDMIAEGDQKSEDRRSWQVEITNRGNQPVLTVAFAEVLCPTARSDKAIATTPP